MSDDLVRVEPPLAPRAALVLPRLIVDAGPVAVEKFLEFFAARIANRRTRAAYGRAVGQFLAWCAARGLVLTAVAPLHVAAYIRTHPGSAPTVKQYLAAIRMLGDWLVVSQVLPVNPAAAVRGPKHVVTTGATPVLSPAEARRLLEAIDTGTLAGLRDRALVSVMLYSFARVSAVIGMRRQDYFRQERQGWLRLHEKGGTRHDVPAHHRAAEALDDYLEAAGLDEPTAALFQSVDPAGRWLTGRTLSRRLVLAMIKRRAAAADLPPSTCCHTFRATGITAYLSKGGTLEHAQQIAGYDSLEHHGYQHQVTVLRGHAQPPAQLMPSGRVSAQTLAAGHPSRRGHARTSGLVPRRVHLPVQPTPLAPPRQAVLSPRSASRRHRSGPLRVVGQIPECRDLATTTCWGHLNEVNSQLHGIRSNVNM